MAKSKARRAKTARTRRRLSGEPRSWWDRLMKASNPRQSVKSHNIHRRKSAWF